MDNGPAAASAALPAAGATASAPPPEGALFWRSPTPPRRALSTVSPNRRFPTPTGRDEHGEPLRTAGPGGAENADEPRRGRPGGRRAREPRKSNDLHLRWAGTAEDMAAELYGPVDARKHQAWGSRYTPLQRQGAAGAGEAPPPAADPARGARRRSGWLALDLRQRRALRKHRGMALIAELEGEIRSAVGGERTLQEPDAYKRLLVHALLKFYSIAESSEGTQICFTRPSAEPCADAI